MKYFFTILLISFCKIECYTQIQIHSNTFINNIISSNAINEAGMDFNDEIIFSTNEILLSITIFPQNLDNVVYKSWQIHVRRNDLDWNEHLELFVRRTGNGKNDYNNKPQNGELYKKIQNNNSFFFEGNGWIEFIPIQLKLKGISVVLPAKSYSTEIIFTLIDN